MWLALSGFVIITIGLVALFGPWALAVIVGVVMLLKFFLQEELRP